MQELVQMVTRQLGGETYRQIATVLGTDPETAEQATETAVPELVQGILGHLRGDAGGAGAGGGGGALGMLGGLLESFGGGSATGGVGGEELLDRLLGGRRGAVESRVEEKTSLGGSEVTRLLVMLAPLVLKAFERVKSGEGGGLASLLDRDGDGQVGDDVAELGASLLGGLFKKR